MGRKRKNGQRALGVQSKKGMLYIVISDTILQDGKTLYKKRWVSTGLKDTPENIEYAQRLRLKHMRPKEFILDNNLTIAELLDVYILSKERVLVDTTIRGYMDRSKRIKDFFGDLKVKNLNTAFVEQFFDYLFIEKGYTDRTVKDTKATFVAAIEMAIKAGIIHENPVKEADVKKTLSNKAKKPEIEDDFFSYDEAMLFLDLVAREEYYKRYLLMFYLTLFFGLRREEVLGLKWSNIDFERKELHITSTVTKGTKVNYQDNTKTVYSAVTFPLEDDQIIKLQQLNDIEQEYRTAYGDSYYDSEYVFKKEDGTLYYPDTFTRVFSKVIKRHKELPQNITFHGLRKSCASILVHRGFDIKQVQKWMRHADVETTLKIYAKAKDKEAKKAVLEGLHEIMPFKNEWE